MDLLSKKYAQAKEIEKLKQDIEAYKQSEQEASEIIAELKAENERLKKELDIALREEDRWKSNFNNYRDVFRKQRQAYKCFYSILPLQFR